MLKSPTPPTAAFDRFNEIQFDDRGPIIVAVSGGGDSIALLHLFVDYCARQQFDIPLLCVTVDHGLRAGSGDEALWVQRHCKALGIEHRTYRWAGPRPERGVQEKARAARYELLRDAAMESGASIVLTGHTQDDALETVAMRAVRAKSGPGLAGIAPATLVDRKVWVVRPLLDVTRQSLRDYLSTNGIEWIDDPSNEDERFERIRVRKQDIDTLHADDLAEQVKAAGGDRLRESRSAAALIAETALFSFEEWPGKVTLNLSNLKADSSFATALRAVVWKMTGANYPPTFERMGKAAAFIRGGEAGSRYTIAGLVLQKKASSVWIKPEARHKPNGGGDLELVTLFDYATISAIADRVNQPPLPKPPVVY